MKRSFIKEILTLKLKKPTKKKLNFNNSHHYVKDKIEKQYLNYLNSKTINKNN